MYRPESNAASDQQFHLSASSSNSFQSPPFSFSPFSATSLLGPSPQTGHPPHHLSPLQRPPSAHDGAQTSQHLSIGSQSGEMRPPDSSTSPRLTVTSLNSGSHGPSGPSDRSLPSRNVTPETITDAYVQFILYCNPNFALNVDATMLKTNFQGPPKSDNKEFETFRLWELIQKFYSKEIKTWGQLALDLGVEPPDIAKGQSVQKVQQYTVRLKRWMHAMHVDAFFEYLLGKQHTYFMEVPPADNPYSTQGRDGVLTEEDLAIRALDPSFRPKRGRRRNSETEADDESELPSSKQARLGDGLQPYSMSSAVPVSANPMTAVSTNFNDPWAAASAVTPQTFAPWSSKPGEPQSAINPNPPTQFRWQVRGKEELATPHPATGRGLSMAAHIDAAFDNEPKSAVTPSGRKRRKHGPAVSSAWPSAVAPGSKPRGRPPASRNMQDGPFSTFPADPNQDASGVANPPSAAPMERVPTEEALQAPQPSQNIVAPAPRSAEMQRPSRLSLQVPQHTGPPIRLATPPRVMVNGESNPSSGTTSPLPVLEAPPLPADCTRTRKVHQVGDFQIMERNVPGFAFEVLRRILASDLLRAELVGRKSRLTGDEAKRLADSILDRLNIPRADTEESKDDIARLTAASWLGLGEQLRVPLGPATGRNKKIAITRFRVDADGYEEPISDAEDDEYGGNTASRSVREVYDLSWSISMGGCNGNFDMKGLSLSTDAGPRFEDTHDFVMRTWKDAVKQAGMGDSWASRAAAVAERTMDPALRSSGQAAVGDDGIDWKSRYHEAMFGASMAKGEFMRIRDRLIEKILDVLI